MTDRSPPTLWHRVEGAAAQAAVRLLRQLGPVRSSELGGALLRSIGPWLPVSRVAHRNLRLALPELDALARRRIVRDVWDNLGRTVAELPHLARLGRTETGPGWELVGAANLDVLAARGGPALLFTGHLGNWEIVPVVAASLGLPLAAFYRPADNPVIDALLLRLRGGAVKMLPKGSRGARQALQHLRQNGYLGVLQDQKMNDGIPARFFGQMAMTAGALATLALRTGGSVVPVRVDRLGPARFRITVEVPLPLPASGDPADDVSALTQAANDRLEAWVRAAPGGWLWPHRRWPKEVYADVR